ncbi:MAG: acyl-CoA dehydrogenase [Spirochaeta sp.]|nr:acyl-CoA dehydrogenase [Spirochaeta sp.]RPG03406.1 MAG: acyl-CoA dehydrogenase [Proteobacteria bacterium TMED72]
MDFKFTDDENTATELARKILADKVTPEWLKEFEASEEAVAPELWQALADSSLLGVAIPDEYGGMDLGFTALALVCQEVGRAVAPVPVYASLVLGALPLAEFGTDSDKSEWLPRVASGEVVLTAALTELDSSDPLLPRTRAEKSGDGFRLFGQKSLVPSGNQAARILIPATTEEGGVILAWVEPGMDGLRIESQSSSNRQAYAMVDLDGVAVTEAQLLGGTSGGRERLSWLVEHSTTALSAIQLGVVERALEMTSEYGRERVQFDRPIGSFQAFHQRAGDAYIMVDCLRLCVWEAIWLLSVDRSATDAVSVAKYWASEGAQFAAFACQHLHGGIGIDVDYPLHRYFIWATQLEHEMGSAKHQLDKIGARIAESGMPEF